jgi:ribonuclease J
MITNDGPELVFVALGGAGEIGMNLNLYGYGQRQDARWLMIDCGISFGTGIPGIDVVMPDARFISDRREQLDGLLLTHAHEDHLGAVPYLWPELRCPIWGTEFALAMLRRKLEEVDWGGDVPLHPIPLQGRFRIGAFDLEAVAVTHSIPEANAVAIRIPGGTVLHSGDWKFDPDPVVGPVSDESALRRIGDEGVLALICDSTNVFEPDRSGSEGELLEGLTRLIAGCEHRVIVTCFATNVARLHTIAAAAGQNGRDVVVTGRSLKRTYAAARACGYLADVAPFIDDEEGSYLPRDRTLILSTGGQGEPNAALMRMANEEHPVLSLEAGDSVIFSSRVIPGNEIAIARLQNQLVRRGITVLTQQHGFIHVSGHPARADLAEMYRLVRPRAAVPVHGELRHLVEHAALARAEGVAETIVGENGTLVRLAPGPAAVLGRVPVGRLALEGNRPVPIDGRLVKERAKAIYNGAAVVTVVLDGALREDDIQVTTIGLVEGDEEDILAQVRTAVVAAVASLRERAYRDDAALKEAVRLAVRRSFRQLFDKRPVTHVHLVRL